MVVVGGGRREQVRVPSAVAGIRRTLARPRQWGGGQLERELADGGRRTAAEMLGKKVVEEKVRMKGCEPLVGWWLQVMIPRSIT